MEPTQEEWRPIPGYEGAYEVSSMGRVRSLSRVITRSDGRPRTITGRVLREWASGRYPKVNLKANGTQDLTPVHRLVAAAFLGPCPEDHIVCHWDDDPKNNRVANLRYDTRSANCADTMRNGNGGRGGFRRLRTATHCANGHEWTEKSRMFIRDGSTLACRICHNENGRRARTKRKASQ